MKKTRTYLKPAMLLESHSYDCHSISHDFDVWTKSTVDGLKHCMYQTLLNNIGFIMFQCN